MFWVKLSTQVLNKVRQTEWYALWHEPRGVPAGSKACSARRHHDIAGCVITIRFWDQQVTHIIFVRPRRGRRTAVSAAYTNSPPVAGGSACTSYPHPGRNTLLHQSTVSWVFGPAANRVQYTKRDGCPAAPG